MKYIKTNVLYLLLTVLPMMSAAEKPSADLQIPAPLTSEAGIGKLDSIKEKASSLNIKISMPADAFRDLAPLSSFNFEAFFNEADIIILAEDYIPDAAAVMNKNTVSVSAFINGAKDKATTAAFAGINEEEQAAANYIAKLASENKLTFSDNYCRGQLFSFSSAPKELLEQFAEVRKVLPPPCRIADYNFMFINSALPLAQYISAAANSGLKIKALSAIGPSQKKEAGSFWFYDMLAKGKKITTKDKDIKSVWVDRIYALKPAAGNKIIIVGDAKNLLTDENSLAKQLSMAGYRVKTVYFAGPEQKNAVADLALNTKVKPAKEPSYAIIDKNQKHFFNADVFVWK